MRRASTLVQVGERARQQVAVPPGRRAVLAIGCEASLWDPLLLGWPLWMRGVDWGPEFAAQHSLAFRSPGRTRRR